MNRLLKTLFKECGNCNDWKRLQDSNEKFKAFGFCEYEHPRGTLNALKILNGYLLGEKKLTVKVCFQRQILTENFTKLTHDSVL